MKKRLLTAFFLLIVVVLASAQSKPLIGFSHVSMNNPYYLAMEKAAKETAAARGADIIVLNAEEDISKQISDIESLLVKGVKGLIVNSTTEYGTMPVIKKAKAMGIPVVAIDRLLYGDYLAYVGIDQWKAGELQGEYITKKLLPKGGNIVMIIGDPGDSASIGRGNGMLSILEKPENKGKYNILGTYKASYNQMLGMQKMEEAIASFGNKIDLVYCANDSMALGAEAALANAKMDKVMICGIDGQKEAYAEILKGGPYKSTVINNSWEITQKAVNILMDYITKKIEPEDKQVITGTILVTADNVKTYYNKDSVF
ncbi:putative D-ribose ABC transporter permease protein [uncultured spirochete]|uniref:Putative D-ribose ABC transporter permease protein n=1 Tax=uncultured spirochete TaxID=156406 RepID=A0A3P3XQ68_9SPIR|nr:putative D-ribose ABC transporter permease protein [uncultured spirochete]